MSEAQTSEVDNVGNEGVTADSSIPPKRKRGRPKGSKNKPKTRRKDSRHYGYAETDTKFKDLNRKRDLTHTEVGILVAEWNLSHDIERAAARLNVEPDNALRWLESAAEHDPRVMDDRASLFCFGVACQTLAMQIIKDFKAANTEAYGLPAAKGADYLMNRGLKYLEKWKDKLKEAPELKDTAAVSAEMEALDEQIARLRGAGETSSTQAEEGRTSTDGGMEQDAGQGGDERG